MLNRDPKCVYVANTFGQAFVVAGWLQDRGILAEVMSSETTDGFNSTFLALGKGVEVWVVDPAQAAEAIELLGEHTVELLFQKQTGPPLEVVCDECGETSTYPFEQRGSVQSCPHCSAYLDVEAEEETDGSPESSEPKRIDKEVSGTDAITEKVPCGVTNEGKVGKAIQQDKHDH
jgi:hypothetical protein